MKYVRHGLRKHPLYDRWRWIKRRCYNEKSKDYPLYGARGISMCDAWLNNFPAFYEWALNNGWDTKLQIDRIDTNGNYEPENCRWVNNIVNSQNRRSDKLNAEKVIEIRKSDLTNVQLAEEFGVAKETISRVRCFHIWKNVA